MDVDHFKIIYWIHYSIASVVYVLIFCLWGMWDLSSLTRDWTCNPCFGRWSLNHWTIREVPGSVFLIMPIWEYRYGMIQVNSQLIHCLHSLWMFRTKSYLSILLQSYLLLTCLEFSGGFLNLFWKRLSFPGGSDGKASVCNVGDLGSFPGLGRSPGEGNGNPLQYPCLENPMDRRTW